MRCLDDDRSILFLGAKQLVRIQAFTRLKWPRCRKKAVIPGGH